MCTIVCKQITNVPNSMQANYKCGLCFLQYTDRVNPMDKHVTVLASKYGISPAPITPQLFGAAGKEHMEKYGQSGQFELRTISSTISLF